MEYDEFKRRLGKAGLSVKEFADLVCVSGNTVSNYAARGSVPVHFAVAVTLMAEMAEHQLEFRIPLKSIGSESSRQRDESSGGSVTRVRQIKINWNEDDYSKEAADLR